MPEQPSRKRKSNPKLRPGVGATCSVLIRFLHPSRGVRDTILNYTSAHRLDNLLLIKEEEKLVNHKNQKCFVFRHDRFPNVELYSSKRWTRIDKEGPELQLFTNEVSTDVNDSVSNDDSAARGGVDEALDDEIELDMNVMNATNTAEDIMYVRGLGLTVDDDNAPAPENVPDPTTPNDEPSAHGLKETQSFGWNGFDERKKYGHYNSKAQMKGLNGIALEGKNKFELFIYFKIYTIQHN